MLIFPFARAAADLSAGSPTDVRFFSQPSPVHAPTNRNDGSRMSPLERLETRNGVCEYRPRGRCTLVEAVDLVTRAIALCRERGVDKLLIDATGLTELPIPTLVDRFLMVEEWAQEAEGHVTVALVTGPEYIHPKKFGVKVASHFGLLCDVWTSDDAAMQWLLAARASPRKSGA
jgi:hypothetical protein